jgi:hypothetical protein
LKTVPLAAIDEGSSRPTELGSKNLNLFTSTAQGLLHPKTPSAICRAVTGLAGIQSCGSISDSGQLRRIAMIEQPQASLFVCAYSSEDLKSGFQPFSYLNDRARRVVDSASAPVHSGLLALRTRIPRLGSKSKVDSRKSAHNAERK